MTQWQRMTHDLIERARVTARDYKLTTLECMCEEWLEQEPAEIASQPEAPDCVFVKDGKRYTVGDDGMTGELPEASRSHNTYEVWRGTEKRKDKIVLETTDIERAARTACADLSGQTFWGMKRQPEAPLRERQAQACESVGFGQLADALHSQPETPKGPADEAEDTESLIEQLDEALCSLLHQGDEIGTHAPREHLDLFYARQASGTLYLASVQGLRDSLAAANARIAELRVEVVSRHSADAYMAQRERADAAERDLKRLVAVNDSGTTEVLLRAWSERDQLAQKLDAAEKNLQSRFYCRNCDEGQTCELYSELEAERDQLAARVTELEADQEMYQRSRVELYRQACTPEERQVLEAMRDYPEFILEDWKREGTPRRKALAVAELANRAAKAKREAT